MFTDMENLFFWGYSLLWLQKKTLNLLSMCKPLYLSGYDEGLKSTTIERMAASMASEPSISQDMTKDLKARQRLCRENLKIMVISRIFQKRKFLRICSNALHITMNLHILEYTLFLFQKFDNLDFMVYNSYCRSIIAGKQPTSTMA